MSLNKIEIVVLLHKLKKVTDVANTLGVKQPTISFHMKSLEEEYGMALFINRSGRIVFTEAGEVLHSYAVKIHALARKTKRVLDEFQNMERGSIKIGASYVPGIYLLSDVLMSFATQYPSVSINLEIQTAPTIQKMLLNHSIDIGLISSDAINSTDLLVEQVIKDELILVVPANHPFTIKKSLSPSDLTKEPFIFHDPQSSTRQMMDAWAIDHQLELHAKFELNSIEIIKKSVALGHGISFISKLAIKKEIDSGILASIPIPKMNVERHIYCCYHKDCWITSPMKLFLEEIRQQTI